MKLKYLLIFLLVLLLGYSFTEPLYTPTAIPVERQLFNFPKIIAHKAIVSGNYFGNTRYAIQEALSSQVDGIEVDIRKSKDNVLFLYHGDTLQQYTNGEGIPEDFTWQQLSRLNYKDSFASSIVSLEEALQLIGSQKSIFLDIKHHKVFDQSMVDALINIINKYHLQKTVYIESFNPIFLSQFRLTSRKIMLMYNFVENSQALGEEVQQQFDQIPWLLKRQWVQKQIRRIVRPDVLGPRFNTSENILQHLINAKYPLIVWTVDDVAIAKQLFSLGIVGIETNVPQKFFASDVKSRSTHRYDAGGTSAQLGEVINVTDKNDIVQAINQARQVQKKITIAGRRHSMGGQTLLDDSIQLDMLSFNNVAYNPTTKTIIAQSGATWDKVQSMANQHHRSIKIMQSDNIFTVGGSVSVNVHGWQVNSPPIADSIVAMNVITADGKQHYISREKNKELFQAVIGGYGLFAVIVDIELATTENSMLTFDAVFVPAKSLEKTFQEKVSDNPNSQLAYARLSVDNDNLLSEAGVFWYSETDSVSEQEQISPEKLIALKRAVFRLSQYHDLGKSSRWLAEKAYSKLMRGSGRIARNDAMNTDIHILWPLYGDKKDILHEYFVPKENINQFLQQFKSLVKKYDMNLLNVTVREVKKDHISKLAYANQDMFALVFLFSQAKTDDAEKTMREFTSETITTATNLSGSFYLPYRLHFNKQNINQAYPQLKNWLTLKKKYDPDEIFYNRFYQYLKNQI